ncbi:hypothetical protein FJM67_05460 [Maribrevibacterium harenarium]|uniref:Transcriptional regulator SutA RNAP-binding domain-containing protein n=1 Tax=Maribrevibacterium harenarium TaxID=2589817 RepID=A0A501WYZ6_9GAMM|nr:hypothetical protein [Maribrevibacterium harenarium]TPE54062.1 hypothetical protein FJM67_05460 [Maribrevibacterium harenarium]
MAKKKAADTNSTETSETIARQMEEFLARGGQIEQVAQGVSGVSHTSGSRHITLGNSKPKA